MNKSKEIRWFTKEPNKSIVAWFKAKGLNFNMVQPRIDHYLKNLSKNDIAPKMREGKIEIKHKENTSRQYKLTKNANGYFEEWVKWSFEIKSTDVLMKNILHSKQYNDAWTAVAKRRLAVVMTKVEDGTIKCFDHNHQVKSGCLVEYTRIKLAENKFYTFNLEWFGEEFIELESLLLLDILGDSILKLEDSMSYMAFINNYESNHQ